MQAVCARGLTEGKGIDGSEAIGREKLPIEEEKEAVGRGSLV